jgi:thiosulfate/3-mercaptopyruvate sulfurtransferase
VAVLDGGMAAWRAAGGAVETHDTGDAVRIGGRLSVHPSLDRLVDADWIRGRMGDSRTLLLDVRPDDEYTGADGGHGMHLAGHIPGAVQLEWQELVDEQGRLLPPARLRYLLAARGAEEADQVVVYCMVGLRASLVYFAARMLNLDVRFYDGSWEDWSNRRYPVEADRPSSPADSRQSCL